MARSRLLLPSLSACLAFGCVDASRALPGSGAGALDAGAPPPDAGAAIDAQGDAGLPWAIDPSAFGHTDLSGVTLAAFSQTGVSQSDPQVLALTPDLVPRAWGQWDTDGLQPGQYGFATARACEAAGIAFVGGLTASVIFVDEMSATDFADEVGRDALGNPVAHSEIVAGAYRGALASPGFRQKLIDIAEIQIDGGVDGLFFDEVNASYTGAGYDGDEGFDDHDVADFGRFLCLQHASDLGAFHLVDSDGLDCASADPGAAFDYRGYMARLGVQGAPLGPTNPLSAAWGRTVANRPNPSAGTFVETYTSLVYWQQIVATVRNYARSRYGKEVLVTSNGIFPFVDFQSVGLYDYNVDGPGPMGFNYVPTTGTAPAVHYDGTASFLSTFASLKAKSNAVMASVGGPPVPLLLFLDWPTPSMDRYYAMPTSERQDYVRVALAEAYAVGEWFALPLATTTDTSTATALGMMPFFQSEKAFYESHAALLRGAQDSPAVAVVSAPSVTSHVTSLPDGRTVVHLINHNYAAGFLPQSGVTVTLPLPQAPASVTLASPDATADVEVTFRDDAGQLTVNVGALTSSAILAIR